MTFDEFKAYFDEHKDSDEVKELVGAQGPELTAEGVTAFLDTDEGRPIKDRFINAAVKSHDEKRDPEIRKQIEEAAKQARDEAAMSTEEKLTAKMAEIEKALNESKAEVARKDMISQLQSEAAKRNVPLDLAVDLDNPSLTLERGVARLDAYAKANKETIDAEINKRMADGHKPGGGKGDDEKALGYDPNDMSTDNLQRAMEAEEAKLAGKTA